MLTETDSTILELDLAFDMSGPNPVFTVAIAELEQEMASEQCSFAWRIYFNNILGFGVVIAGLK